MTKRERLLSRIAKVEIAFEQAWGECEAAMTDLKILDRLIHDYEGIVDFNEDEDEGAAECCCRECVARRSLE